MADTTATDGASAATPKVVPFSDLGSGGHALAARLESAKYGSDVLVLGIVLGGVLAAHEVAKCLNAPLDYVILKRLLAPQGSASVVSAVNVGGTLVVEQEFLDRAEKKETGLDYFLSDALSGLSQREQICRGGRPPTDISNKTVILVDNGVRTGMTMKTTINAIRKMKPRRIIAAAPVGSLDGAKAVEAIADETIILVNPEPFGNVALWYTNFNRPQDNAVSQVLDRHDNFQRRQ